MEFPKLRGLEAFPITVSGRKMIGLRDPLNLSNDIIAVPHQLYLALTMLDGQHSVMDIQAEYMRRAGELIFRETIEELVSKLDEGLFLDNDNFRTKQAETENDFKQATVRRAMLAGKSYSDDPAALAQQIQGFFLHADGPGLPSNTRTDKKLKGIIAPHIDFSRGGPCFAWAYKEVAEHIGTDIFVIFGTAHAFTNTPFVATYKDFETPFGTLPCNREFVRELQDRMSFDLLQDEFVHRGEHSIEFQTLFLKYLFKENGSLSIVPILCGSFHEIMAAHSRPMEHARVKEFVKAFKAVASRYRGGICFIAGADLAHVGPKFGDKHPLSDGFLRLLKADDLRMLEPLERAYADGFYGAIEADGDRRKICGLPPIYTMVSVMGATSGRLLNYQQWPDPQGTVTFASMAFF